MVGIWSTLISRTEVAEETMAFNFERPRSFLFKAGQYIDLTLLGPQPGSTNGLTHTFSIASSPFADDLVVTTRMRDTVFKRALSALPIGAKVRIEGPMGSFTLHNNPARPAVLLVLPTLCIQLLLQIVDEPHYVRICCAHIDGAARSSAIWICLFAMASRRTDMSAISFSFSSRSRLAESLSRL